MLCLHNVLSNSCLHGAGASVSGPACDQGYLEVPWTDEVLVRKRAGDTLLDRVSLQLVDGVARAADPIDKNEDLFTADGAVRHRLTYPWLKSVLVMTSVQLVG